MCTTHIILFTISYNASSSQTSRNQLIQYFLLVCMGMSFVRDRVSQMCRKFYTFVLVTVCAWKIKKQRKKSALVFIILNFVFFLPFILLLILLASLQSAPLLPVFTFPFYLYGFPRYKRFWPQKNDLFSLENFWNFRVTKSGYTAEKQSSKSSTACILDSNFYAQLMPDLIKSFKELVRSGSIGSSIRPEHFYLSRFQDRILWIQVVHYL